MIVNTFRDTVAGMWSLLVGLKVTGKYFFHPHVTVHYPRQTVPSLEGYRGHIELVPMDDDPFKSKCIACSSCVRMCPAACIQMKATKPKKAAPKEGDTDKAPPKKAKPEVKSFVVDYNYCCLCGLCVENCPTDALRYSSEVYLAGFTRQEFVIDLLARLEHQAQKKEQ